MMLQVELPELDRLQRYALIFGAVGVIATVIGALSDSVLFFRSYLLAYVYWVSIALGSLGILMLHNLVGGLWGAAIRRFLESAMKTLPVMAVLIIPILAGMPALYHWAHADAVAQDALLRHKEPYLNVPFFIGRTIFYFALWIVLSILLLRNTAHGPATTRAKAISGPGLILFVFSVTFAAIDWIMSLEPHWFSTIYGAIFVVGQTLEALAFCVIMLSLLSGRQPFAGLIGPRWFHDLGNLLLAFTVLWAYTSFSQFLIIWSGNIPEETPWYIRRSTQGWQIVGVMLVLFHFAVPFFVLLSRYVKKRGQLLARVAIGMMLVRMLDLFYWVAPAFHDTHGFSLHWMHFAAALGLGGLWIWLFAAHLKKGPLLYVDDPRLQPEGGH